VDNSELYQKMCREAKEISHDSYIDLDQLFEMVDFNAKLHGLSILPAEKSNDKIAHYIFVPNIGSGSGGLNGLSFEQVILQYVMATKHRKKWNGETWVSDVQNIIMMK
jgi:hypothetical protein